MKSLISSLLTLLVLIPNTSFGKSRGGNSIPLYISAAGSFSLVQDSDVGSTDPLFNTLLGMVQAHVEFETGYAATFAAGVLLKKRFRIEVEYSYKSFDEEKGFSTINSISQSLPSNTEYSINSILANTVFDWRNSSRFTPYVGAGLGVGFIEKFNPAGTAMGINFPEIQISDSVLAYQFFGGINYWITRNFVGFLGYKYFATDDLIHGTSTRDGFKSHSLEFGLRFFFGRP